MTKIQSTYKGDLAVHAIHGPTQSALNTDAPKDNEGLGRTFSPTDLMATSLTACALTIMGIVAKRDGIDMIGATAEVEKVMSTSPRRIGGLPMQITVPGKLSSEQRKKLEAAAHSCPVHKSLHPDIDAPITFAYPDAE